MKKPVRIQRSRKKGTKLVSPNGLPIAYVGRPGQFGNPWGVRECAEMLDLTENSARHHVVAWFKEWLAMPNDDEQLDDLGSFGGTREQHRYIHEHLHELRGKNLACWCPLTDKHGAHVPCHADVLLEIANA